MIMPDENDSTPSDEKQAFNKKQLIAQRTGIANRKHGLSWNPEYFIWHNMIDRCYNPRSKRYGRYGGRGIKVCESWLHSVTNFYNDMGPRPSSRHSLDRINNDGHYSCGKCNECIEHDWIMNCRWATYKEQNRNNSRTRMLTFNNKTQCIADWSDETGIGRVAIRKRLQLGWTIEDTLTLPSGQKKQKKGVRARRID
jgi:hypothetical protein